MASTSKTIGDLIGADGAVTIPGDGIILASDLADNSVTTSKIVDANVTNEKIDSVAASKITGTLDIAYGGTGATSSTSALDNLLPGGEVSGYVLKTGGSGSYYWGSANAVSGNSVGTIINSTRIVNTANASQTVFSSPTYTQGANQLRVYIDGVRQFPSAYTETSNTSFTLGEAQDAGTIVLAEVDGYVDYTVNASDVVFSPTSDITSNNAQDAIAEVASDLSNLVVQTSGLADSAVTTAKIADANVTMAKLSATGTASSSTFLRGDGAWQAAGGFSNMQVFTSSGTWTNPGQVTKVKVTVTGGGGGGGRSDGTATTEVSGAGGGTAIEVTTIPTSPVSVTVGSGGAAGAWPSQTGGTGGTSSFGSYCSATGGVGGTGNQGTANPVGIYSMMEAAGGAGSGGTVNLRGGPSGRHSSLNPGGTSIYGRGGSSLTSATPQPGTSLFDPARPFMDADVYGAGGGALRNSSNNNSAGDRAGSGKSGLVIVEW